MAEFFDVRRAKSRPRQPRRTEGRQRPLPLEKTRPSTRTIADRGPSEVGSERANRQGRRAGSPSRSAARPAPGTGLLATKEVVQQALVFLSHVHERQAADLEIVVDGIEPGLGAGPDDLVGPGQRQLQPHDPRQGEATLDQLLYPQSCRAEIQGEHPEPAVADVLVQEELHANA